MLLTLVMFLAASAGIAGGWNRFFERVPWRIVLVFVALVAVHQAETLLTDKVAIPGVSRFSPYPWKIIAAPAVRSNNGIVFTQLAPWTRIARDQLLAGEMPLWNRHTAGGAPLMANQQTAIFHPFTLLGLRLTVGKAFTLSAALRLFVVLFFTFTLLSGAGLRSGASIFGATAYAFCTFHIIWLLFPLGLATMMLPMALTGAQELARTGSRASYVLLTLGLALSVLGGHPESALWVWITTSFYALYCRKRVVLAASAFVVAGLLTAFFWYPTLRAADDVAVRGLPQPRREPGGSRPHLGLATAAHRAEHPRRPDRRHLHAAARRASGGAERLRRGRVELRGPNHARAGAVGDLRLAQAAAVLRPRADGGRAADDRRGAVVA